MNCMYPSDLGQVVVLSTIPKIRVGHLGLSDGVKVIRSEVIAQ